MTVPQISVCPHNTQASSRKSRNQKAIPTLKAHGPLLPGESKWLMLAGTIINLMRKNITI